MAGKPVSRQIYTMIKKYINDHGFVAKDDPKVMKKFGYGKTVVRLIRRTKDYDEYTARVFRFHGNPRKTQVSQVVCYSKQQDFNGAYIRMKLSDITREIGYVEEPIRFIRDQQDEVIRLLGIIAVVAFIALGLLAAILVKLLLMGAYL